MQKVSFLFLNCSMSKHYLIGKQWRCTKSTYGRDCFLSLSANTLEKGMNLLLPIVVPNCIDFGTFFVQHQWHTNRRFWPIAGTLTDTTTPGHNITGSNGDEGLITHSQVEFHHWMQFSFTSKTHRENWVLEFENGQD